MIKKAIALVIGGLLVSGYAVATDTDQCDQCHGANGNSTDGKVPSIAGMSAAYIGDTLASYAAGDRPAAKYTPAGGSESDMQTVAKGLSEADIAAVAAHYAGQTYQPREQAGDPALMAAGKSVFQKRCEKCHSDSGSVAEDDAGLLLGQGKEYLQAQIDAFTSGARYMPKKMKKAFKKISDDDKKAIVEYLAGGKI